jgi:hypothetical protein
MQITFFIQFLFALLVATVFAVTLVSGLGRIGPGPWSGILFFLFLLFLLAWAGGLWLPPSGPGISDVQFLPFLMAGLLGLLLIAAIIPRRARGTMRDAIEETEKRHEQQDVSGITLGVFYWIVVVLLVASIVARV